MRPCRRAAVPILAAQRHGRIQGKPGRRGGHARRLPLQQGRQVASDLAAKLYLLLDGVRNGRTDGGLVRLTTPILDDALPGDPPR